MKRFSEQLQNKANSVRLSTAEKQDLRERLVSYMEYHPLPLPLKESGVAGASAAVTPVRLVHINGWRLLQSIGAVVGVFMLTISYLAERSVPGDSLYAVKVRFNEEVRSTLALGSYEKVVWETERLNRRIAEARLLASEGRLTEAVEAGVAEAVRTHSENARREIEVLKQTDKEEAVLAAIQLDTTIEVQTTALAKETQAAETLTESTTPSLIAEALRDSQSNAEVAVVSEVDTLPSYERLTAHVEQETTRAYELLKSVEKSATPDEKADIGRRLEDIERSIQEAITEVDVEEVAARHKLIAVLQRTQKLIVFMTNIDIRHTVSVEEIVPVTLTVEERNAAVKQQAEEIILIEQAALPVLEATTTDAALQEKLSPALTQSVAIASSTLAQLPLGEADLPTVESAIVSAVAVARDVALALSLGEPTKPIPEVDIRNTDEVLASTTDVVGTTTESQPVTEVGAESAEDGEGEVESVLDSQLPLKSTE